MSAWLASPYRAVGIYFGGINRACLQPNLTPDWVAEQVASGWHLMPLYMGLQAPCTTSNKKFLFTAANAAAQGRANAEDAVAQATALGLARGSVLINDMEAYRTDDAGCRTAVKTFISAWSSRVHDLGYLSGFYGSLGSGVADQVAVYNSTTYVRTDYLDFARQVGTTDVTCIPLSALKGDNIIDRGAKMPWYRGVTLTEWLETVEIDEERLQKQPFRLPVQWVNRPNSEFRGFAGTIASGTIRPGDRVRAQPSGRESRVARIVAAGGDLQQAVTGQSITLTLTDEIDVTRGDLLVTADAPAEVANQFDATVVWMGEVPMLRGRTYVMKLGAKTVAATIAPLRYRINVNTLEHLAAERLELNEIGVCELELDQPIAFDPYVENRETGGFILVDRLTNNTVGAGMLRFALHRAHNIHRQHVDVDKAARAEIKGQRPCVVWLTGLSGAGKSTIANLVEKRLHAMGRHTYILDGDNVRHGLAKDLGFNDQDRVENIRRLAEVAKLMVDAGLIVLTAFISPFRAERRMARGLLNEDEFIEVFVDTPLSVAELRDTKGLYKKARGGEIKNFTGIDSPYEEPEAPEIRIETTAVSAADAAEKIIAELKRMGIITGS